jgi:hypothetical protein
MAMSDEERERANQAFLEKWREASNLTILNLTIAHDALLVVETTQSHEGFRVHSPYTGYMRGELRKVIDRVGMLLTCAKAFGPDAEFEDVEPD